MTCKQTHLALLIVIPLVATGTSIADEYAWPSVRGPSFNGHSNYSVSVVPWSDEGPPVLWARKLGQGYSAFVAQDDRVYTQAQDLAGQYVFCLDANTGETVWKYRFDWPYEAAGVYPGPRSTPTLSHDSLYFTSPDGLLACLDLSDGKLIWSVDLKTKYGIEGCDFGYACSPTLTDGRLILPVGGVENNAGVVAFDAVSGTEIWRSTTEPASYTPALPIELNGQKLVVCYMQNSLLVLHRDDGSEYLRTALSRGYDEHSAWPIYEEPHLWLSAPFRAGSYLLDLSKTEDGPEIWRSKRLSNDICSSVMVDGFLYGFDIVDVQSKTHRPSRGIFRCLEFSTGKERWSIGTGRPRRPFNAEEFKNDIGQSGIVVAGQTLVILNELGELILLKVDPDKPVELARCTLLSGELTWTPPCLHRGRVYARNQSEAVCVYIGDTAELDEKTLSNTTQLSNRTYHDLASTLLPIEPEFVFDAPSDRWLRNWFLVGAAIVVFGCLLADATSTRGWKRHADVMFWMLAGAVGTTTLGHLTGEFIFTWHVCVFAALTFAARPRESTRSPGLWRFLERRIGLAVFLAVCFGYFLLCRRLSLVFEWAFLFGLVGGFPIVWLTRSLGKHRWTNCLVSLAGYAALFGSTVALLKYRY